MIILFICVDKNEEQNFLACKKYQFCCLNTIQIYISNNIKKLVNSKSNIPTEYPWNKYNLSLYISLCDIILMS